MIPIAVRTLPRLYSGYPQSCTTTNCIIAAGLVEIYDPYNGFFDNTYGLGLCAFLVYSDE